VRKEQDVELIMSAATREGIDRLKRPAPPPRTDGGENDRRWVAWANAYRMIAM
jgi:hypothetical protein